MFSIRRIVDIFLFVFGLAFACYVVILTTNQLRHASHDQVDEFEKETLSVFLQIRDSIELAHTKTFQLYNAVTKKEKGEASIKANIEGIELDNFSYQNNIHILVKNNLTRLIRSELSSSQKIMEGLNTESFNSNKTQRKILLSRTGRYWLEITIPIKNVNGDVTGIVKTLTDLSNNIDEVLAENQSVVPSSYEIRRIFQPETIQENNSDKFLYKKARLFDEWSIEARNKGLVTSYISIEFIIKNILSTIFVFGIAISAVFYLLKKQLFGSYSDFKLSLNQFLQPDFSGSYFFKDIHKDPELKSLMEQIARKVSVNNKKANNIECGSLLVEDCQALLENGGKGAILTITFDSYDIFEKDSNQEKYVLDLYNQIVQKFCETKKIYRLSNVFFVTFFDNSAINTTAIINYLDYCISQSKPNFIKSVSTRLIDFSSTETTPIEAASAINDIAGIHSFGKKEITPLDRDNIFKLKNEIENETIEAKCSYKQFVNTLKRPVGFEISINVDNPVVRNNNMLLADLYSIAHKTEYYFRSQFDSLSSLIERVQHKKKLRYCVNIPRLAVIDLVLVGQILEAMSQSSLDPYKVNLIANIEQLSLADNEAIKLIKKQGFEIHAVQETQYLEINSEILQLVSGITICCEKINLADSQVKQDLGSTISYYQSYGVKAKFDRLSSFSYQELKKVTETSTFSGDFTECMLTEEQVINIVESRSSQVTAS